MAYSFNKSLSEESLNILLNSLSRGVDESVAERVIRLPDSGGGDHTLLNIESFNEETNLNNFADDLLEYLNRNQQHRKASDKDTTQLSEIEASILFSSNPIESNEIEEIVVHGERGIWINKNEVVNWKGTLPISQYEINMDQNPQVITKQTAQQIEYIQELAIRYLRPPSPPNPGEIVITQEANMVTPPAPPLIIRQQPARPSTPEPLVVREAPPAPPQSIGIKRVVISGKQMPPPPRKVVIERLAPLPTKPQPVIIERWLPYRQQKRKIIFQRSTEPEPVVVKPKNVIIQWEEPQVVIKQNIKYLGIISANPVEYVNRYGSSLKTAAYLPQFVLDIKPPEAEGLTLAADCVTNTVFELEGEVEALKLVDLDREGLAEYKPQLDGYTQVQTAQSNSSTENKSLASMLFGPESIQQLFALLDKDSSGQVNTNEVETVILRLNSRLNKSYGEENIKQFFRSLDNNADGKLDYDEFQAIFTTFL